MAKVPDDLSIISPEFAKMTKEIVFDDIWNRPELSKRDRSLITITALASMNRIEQIDYHLGYGLDNGLSEKEIIAALTHVAFYAGWPCAVSGLLHFKKVLEDRKNK
jgi:4-carboxymuconolactone decarboxylase